MARKRKPIARIRLAHQSRVISTVVHNRALSGDKSNECGARARAVTANCRLRYSNCQIRTRPDCGYWRQFESVSHFHGMYITISDDILGSEVAVDEQVVTIMLRLEHKGIQANVLHHRLYRVSIGKLK